MSSISLPAATPFTALPLRTGKRPALANLPENHSADQGAPSKEIPLTVPRSRWPDVLAISSLSVFSFFSLLMLFSKPLSKKAAALIKNEAYLAKESAQWEKFSKSVSEHNLKPLVFALPSMGWRKIIRAAADHDKLKGILRRFTSIAGLVQLSTGYQVAINTQQPGKLTAAMIWTARSLWSIVSPKGYSNALAFLGQVFFCASERNDIENNIHIGNRRELDMRHIFKRQELGHATHFILDDLAFAFSPKPWLVPFQNLQKAFRRTENGISASIQTFNTNDTVPYAQRWKNARKAFETNGPVIEKEKLLEPKSYQSALASQLNAITGAATVLLALAANKKLGMQEFFKEKSTAYNLLQLVAKGGGALSILTSSLPVGMRGWQSRHESDGILALISIPVATISKSAVASGKINSLTGLGFLGPGLLNESRRQTSRKYRASVDYLKHLYNQALKNPNMTARAVLAKIEADPSYRETLRKRMGEVRVAFVVNTLKNGVQAQQMGIPLTQFLKPLTIAAEESESVSHKAR